MVERNPPCDGSGQNIERSIESKIERLRGRIKSHWRDSTERAILLGILDLLGDEL